MELTYGRYLKVEELLQLQQPLSEGPEHDEMLFIIIHQVYELWFKQILHELEKLKSSFREGERGKALHTLKRIRSILKVLVSQVDVLETMTPLEFLSFRERLQSASGFQSCQFRELEFTLGLKNPKHLEHYPQGSEERNRLEKKMEEPSLWDVFLQFLSSLGHDSPKLKEGGRSIEPPDSSEDIQDLLEKIYRNHPDSALVCEMLTDLDEGLQEWRYRHVQMVRRTIGTKSGTGGSSGVDYLKGTLMKPLFPDLWAIRNRF